MSYQPILQPGTLARVRAEMANNERVKRAYVKVHKDGVELFWRAFTPGTTQELEAAVASESVMRNNFGSLRAVSVRCTGLLAAVPVIGEAVQKRKRRVK